MKNRFLKLKKIEVLVGSSPTNKMSIEKPLSDQFSGAFKTGWNGLTQVLVTLTNLWPLIILGFLSPYYLLFGRKLTF